VGGHILAQRLDELYRGRTFGDLRARPGAPELLVTATDLTTGAPFDFTPEQFALICSDLDRMPLSFAIAASSAVPILLSPMTLQNHAGTCTSKARPVHKAGDAADYRTRMLALAAEGYRDAAGRPFVHLVDGGVSDNTGARLMLDRLVASGSIASSFPNVPPGTIRRMVLITVNSERDLAERIDGSDRVPSTSQVVETLVFGAGARETQVTLAMLNDDNRRWQEELLRTRGKPGSPFAADAELHIVSVSLHDVPDDKIRHSLLRVPTAFTIDANDVLALQKAGAEALRAAPAFGRLKASLAGLAAPRPPDPPTAP
jgi:NTE family protein